MTATDWFGLLLTIVIFILMFGMYFWALRPKNKEKLESHRTMPLHEDETEAENKDVR
ncbi:MAG: cbb3-type cytochrome c oxidase subunit 3 [Methylophaga sp.]|nr:cbb3-type cytochrome c oxidase subunit 3 [Methylophaga sp.]